MRTTKKNATMTLALTALLAVLILVPTGFALAAGEDEPMGFIERFDEDGDGKVSQDEFPTPEKLFAQMDANGDGFLEADEAPARRCRRGKAGMRFIERFDEDGDGKVSLDEFPTPEKRFAQMDTNSDGVIDKSETKTGRRGHGRREGDLIERFDEDGDGVVSQDEFPTPEKLFTKMDVNGDGFVDESEAPKGPPAPPLM